MTGDTHEGPLLGAMVLGVLDPAETEAAAEHMATCPQCRDDMAIFERTKTDLALLEPGPFVEGPPEGGDLLLQRTLRRARAEASRPRWQRFTAAAAAMVVLIGGGVGVGFAVEDPTTPATTAATPAVPGTRVLTGTSATGAVRMTAKLTPATGWVRLTVLISGIPSATRCDIYVVPTEGPSQLAGGWLTPAENLEPGTEIPGSATVAPDQVASVQVVDHATGAILVSASA